MVRESVTNIRSLRVWVTPLRLLAEAQMILPVYIDPGVESLAGLSTHTCTYIRMWLLLLIFIYNMHIIL